MQRTAVVTGGTGGIGQHTATGLAQAGFRVLITGRDARRGETARASIIDASSSQDIEVILADMADLRQVDQLAEEIRRRTDRLDVLVNNAGAINHGDTVTVDGIELAFAVNVVAVHRLTTALRPLLAAADRARVINVTGGSPSSTLRTERLNDPTRAAGLGGYSNTKRALEAVSLHVADELAADGTGLAVVYPGGASTSMTGAMTPDDFPFPMSLAAPLIKAIMVRDDGGKSAAHASRSSITAATSTELALGTPTYLKASTRPGSFPRSVTDSRAQRRVVQLIDTAVQAAGHEPPTGRIGRSAN